MSKPQNIQLAEEYVHIRVKLRGIKERLIKMGGLVEPEDGDSMYEACIDLAWAIERILNVKPFDFVLEVSKSMPSLGPGERSRRAEALGAAAKGGQA